MSEQAPSGKRATIWLQDFYGNAIVARLSLSDQGALLAVILAMNAMDCAEITPEVIRNAATHARVKPSRISQTLDRCSAIFDRRDDGTLFSSKTARRVGDRKYRRKGQESGEETAPKTAWISARKPEAKLRENPNKSPESASDVRERVKEKEQEKASKREGSSLESIQESAARPALAQGVDPLAALAELGESRATAQDWEKVLREFRMTPAAALELWNRQNGDGARYLESLRGRSGTAFVRALLNHLTSQP